MFRMEKWFCKLVRHHRGITVSDIMHAWHRCNQSLAWFNIYTVFIMYVNSLFHCYCWDLLVSFNNNYSTLGLCFRGLIFLRPFFVWMDVKSSTIGTISHLRSVASVMKSSKDLKWDSDIVFTTLFTVLWARVCPIICSVSIPSWFIWLPLRHRAWSIWRGLHVWLRQ